MRSVLTPVATHDKWFRARERCVLPIERKSFSGLLPVDAGVLSYAREGGDVVELFTQHCRNHLCSESWDFILVAVHYEVLALS